MKHSATLFLLLASMAAPFSVWSEEEAPLPLAAETDFPSDPYDITDRTHDLHRKAGREFLQGHYENSEACFGHALKSWPESRRIMIDYALCAALYPAPLGSLERAKALLFQARRAARSSRGRIASAVIAWQSGETPEQVCARLEGPNNLFWNGLIAEIKGRVLAGEPPLNLRILHRLLPYRSSLRTIRSERH